MWLPTWFTTKVFQNSSFRSTSIKRKGWVKGIRMGNKSTAPVGPTNTAGAIGYTKYSKAPNVVRRTPASEFKLVFTGPCGAGKTRLLYCLRFSVKDKIYVIPTIGVYTWYVHARRLRDFFFLQQMLILPFLGYNTQKISLNSRLKATIYDFGGGHKITPCFRFFYPGCRGIVFIIPRFWATYYHEWLSDLKKDEKPKEVAIT